MIIPGLKKTGFLIADEKQCFRILFPSYESPQTPCSYHYVRHYAGLRPVYIRIILAMDKTPYYDIDRNGKPFGHSVLHCMTVGFMPLFRLTGIFNPGADPTVSDYCLTITTTMAGNLQPINITSGAVIFPSRDFNPQTAVTIGNGYFTDGKNTVFCAPYTRINNELTGLQKLYQQWRYGWGLSDKPLTYYYPQQPLPPSATPYRISGFRACQ